MPKVKSCPSCFFKSLDLKLVLALMVLFLVGACAGRKLPEEAPPKISSQALEPAGEGELADLADKIAAKFGKEVSSVFPMDRNDEALHWRLMLADLAEKSIDLQVFIWHDDATGNLLLNRLIAAAERGVRVACWSTICCQPQTRALPPWTIIPTFRFAFSIPGTAGRPLWAKALNLYQKWIDSTSVCITS